MRAALKPRQRRSQCLTYTSTISSLWELRYRTITVNRMGKSISFSLTKSRIMWVLYEVPLWLTDRATDTWRWVGEEGVYCSRGWRVVWDWDWGFLSGRRSFNGYLMSCECGTLYQYNIISGVCLIVCCCVCLPYQRRPQSGLERPWVT